MDTPAWYVLTGGPSAGKTSTVEALRALGYTVVEEEARAFIEEELAAGKTLAEIRQDEVAFQLRLLERKVEKEKHVPKEGVVFFDRGMHDSAAYLHAQGVTDHPALAAALESSRYKKVFLLDLLPFVQDEIRTESLEQAARIHDLLRHAYETAGMRVHTVPVLPLKQRVELVLANL